MLHNAVFHYEGIQKHCLCYLNKFKVIYVICVHFSPSHLNLRYLDVLYLFPSVNVSILLFWKRPHFLLVYIFGFVLHATRMGSSQYWVLFTKLSL